MWKLLHGLIWPAVAGSVVWAVCTVAVDRWSAIGDAGYLVIAQLVALLFFAVYLAAGWWYTNIKEVNMRPYYWPFDALFAIAITVSAMHYRLLSLKSRWPNTPWRWPSS